MYTPTWKSKPKRTIVKADTLRKLELLINDKELYGWEVAGKIRKESSEMLMTDPSRKGNKYKKNYINFHEWICVMEYKKERVII